MASVRTYEVALSHSVPHLGAGLQEPTAPSYARVIAEFDEQGGVVANITPIVFPRALEGRELVQAGSIHSGWGPIRGWAVLDTRTGRIAYSGRIYRDYFPESYDVEYADKNVQIVFPRRKLAWRVKL